MTDNRFNKQPPPAPGSRPHSVRLSQLLPGRRSDGFKLQQQEQTIASIYSPLPSGSHTIRLLDLLPGKWGDDINVRLQECTIAEARDRYISISYTWGEPGTVKQMLITCNRSRVPISENLYTLLRRLRRPERQTLVWADALCINQTDPSERTHQVGLMGEIYKNSKETIIWLGEEADSDDTGYRFLNEYITEEDSISMGKGAPPGVAWQGNDNGGDQRLLDAYLANSKKRGVRAANDIFGAFCLIQSFAQGTSSSALKFLEESELTGQYPYLPKTFLDPSSKASRVWAGLARLMSRPWWRRIWVIQETVLSRKATVHFGMLSAPWSMFARAASNFARERHSLCLDLAGTLRGHDILTQFSDLVLQIHDTRLHHQASVKDVTLLSLLWKFRPLEASDKRDKVFALLGLTTDWQGMPPLSPDYSADVGAVFVQTAIRNILMSASLSVLSGDLEATLNRKRLTDIPSWVMDWALPCLPVEIERVQSQKMYNASGGRTSEVSFHHRHSILHVQGLLVDQVIAVGDVSRHTQISDTCAVIRQWNLLAMAFEEKRGNYPSGCSYYDAFWRTLVGNLVQMASVANSIDGKQTAYRKTTAEDTEAFRAWRMWSRCISRDTIGRTASFTQRDLDEGISSIHYALKTATTSRRFFLTRSGYMGVGPKTTQPGDKLYVLENSKVPFLVRPHSVLNCNGGLSMMLIEPAGGDAGGLSNCCFNAHSCHRLVGDCFAYGLMDGEAFERPGAEVVALYLA
ncbi:heterokaryon incompatibility protein-domain-containing protein [Clohesyomyces aquaticus]|uniref:Heterokaryon incompatibility protein-domain-containing protein n=1 Tax=Clohesyomyces aquaticus TaxID=1231657 RepID=A0A1Y1ZFL7_9PLEO|nr:heterokaryon incompatibility protein-domain-containing protein [Clohesyomyces aquaticus]